MPINADVLKRKLTHFILWRPNANATSRTLVIGRLQMGNPPTLIAANKLPLTAVAGAPGLWGVAAIDCQLQDGQIYHYWFEVDDTGASTQPSPPALSTDP